jgi:hypothetical protein
MTSPIVAKEAPLGIMFVRISTASTSTRTRAPMHKVTYWNRRNSIRHWLADITRLPTWNRMKNATIGRTTATISTGPRSFGINPRTRTGANQMAAGSAPSHIAIRTIHARVSAAVNITEHGHRAERFFHPHPLPLRSGPSTHADRLRTKRSSRTCPPRQIAPSAGYRWLPFPNGTW